MDMQQPNLGKKIAKLRKAKGLTQEELVEKCNLSVRTLQRIEAGEVTPRSYTIKLIFAALGHNAYEQAPGLPGRLKATSDVMINGFLKFYRYIIDLFNLKTDAMKKLTILSIFSLTVCTVILSACLSTKKAISSPNPLVGTWQILNSNGIRDTMYSNQQGLTRYKMITTDRFIVLDVLYKQGLMAAAMSGPYTIDNNIYTENITTAGNGYNRFLGAKNAFKYKITDSLLYINGINNPYNEVWKKVK
ncbi:transcriptional regulator with XRE-family HTH domain [Mucilaginibacter dorajii]|uniref:HTH cro/C1-type domain-containing protein n=2 Tax=Mucilaginibacter dorajii TaxID=692994 RepID=A0ABP7PBZ6_9SPHI|nr:transcriptional regulator with XRE-family HTH domain [Mucilaginibacter dorajii]